MGNHLFLVVLVFGVLGKISCQISLTVRARLGDSAELPCSSGQQADNVVIRWKSETNGMLTTGVTVNKYRGQIEVIKQTATDWTLKIIRVDHSFADVYTCLRNGEALFVVTLKISVPPVLDAYNSSPSKVTVNEGDTTELKCSFTGEPSPEVTWSVGDQKKREIGIKGEVLKIKKTPRYSTDIYTCTGTNTINSVDHIIELTVKFKPDVRVKDTNLYVDQGKEVTFACVIFAEPLLDSYWETPRGDKIVSSNWKYEITKEQQTSMPMYVMTLMIRELTWGVHDYGVYNCHALGDGSEGKGNVTLSRTEERPISYN